MDKAILDLLHSEMLVIYSEIARICDKYNLTYFVVGGTLLGAVVHKGYIPWDDDLDIAMPRDDYDKFIYEYSKELDDRFYLHHTTTDPDYWLPFAKVRLNNTVFLEEKRKNVKSHAGIYVDVFPFDYAPKQDTLIQRIKWRIMTYENNYINSTITGREAKSTSSLLLNKLFSLISIEKLSYKRDELMRSFDCGQRIYFVDLAGGRTLDNSFFSRDDILPVQILPFADGSVVAPNKPDKYLVQLYTEKYKIIPPKEQQITHEPVYIRFRNGVEYKNSDIHGR